MFGPKGSNVRLHKLHEEEFCDIYALSNIIWVFFMFFMLCIFLQLIHQPMYVLNE
jgi:hypothetical protein